MKKIGIFIFLLLTILLFSCEKEVFIHLGFDAQIQKNSKGLVIADISKNVEKIYLQGFISLQEGEAEILLLDPDGHLVYSVFLTGPDHLNIDETFEAGPGYWKLKYVSREGLGEIDLHLNKY